MRHNNTILWVKGDAPDDLPDLAEPTPVPTVERIIIEVSVEPDCDPYVNPRYSAQIEVSAGGRPIGIAIGRACESQDAAQADAERVAAEMKEARKP